MSLVASIRRGLLLAASLPALACAPVTVPASYESQQPPQKAYAGPPLPRREVAVILVQINSREIAHLAVAAIDAKPVLLGWGYALLPGPHSLKVVGLRAKSSFPLGIDVAATLQVEAPAAGLLGLRVAEQNTVELVDLNQGNLLLASAPLEAVGSRQPSCGLGFELVIPLALLAAWRRRGPQHDERADIRDTGATAQIPGGGPR